MSHRAPQSQKLSVAGPAGRLEAIIDMPARAIPHGTAVVCHPHPQHGGTMRNKVVHTLARAFARMDFAALRFNFRGTEGSEGDYDAGEGELYDALAAIEWMRSQYPGDPLWLAGFSFGAAIAIRAATMAPVSGLISVAPAVIRLDRQPNCPWLVISGDQDELVDVADTIVWMNSLEPGPELTVMPGAEHFFHGRLNDLRESVTGFVERHG